MSDVSQALDYDPRTTDPADGSAWSVYRRLLGYAFAYKLRLAVSLFFAVAVAASFGSMLLSVGAAVNITYGPEESAAKAVERAVDAYKDIPSFVQPWPESDFTGRAARFVGSMRDDPMRTFRVLGGVFVILAFIGGLSRFLQEYLAGSIGARISVRLGEEMYANVLRLSMRFFEKHTTGEILARHQQDIFMVNRGLAGVFVKMMREPIKALVFLGIALWVHWRLTLIALLVLPAVGYIIARLGKKIKKSARRSLQKLASMAAVANETFSGITIVKGYCMEDYEIRRTGYEFERLRHYLLRMIRADALVTPLVEVVIMTGLVLFLLYAGAQVRQGAMSGGNLVQLIGALALMLDPVRKLAKVNNDIQTSVASAERVFEFIDAKPDVVEKPGATELPRLTERIRFVDVSFSYDGRTPVLEDVHLDIVKGEMVALVGPSGAGKSTIAKLLPRFYDVTRGAITFDGVDIRDVTFQSLRDQIGIVTQDTYLFNETVRANISFGRDDYTDEQIKAAARAANIHHFIEKLYDKYDTVIGERGGILSGGQRQRLAIARAIVKDPAVLILDEATSSLDSESERAIQQALDEFTEGRTTLVIAHRLSTVRKADRILVLCEGRIVEQGPHEQLLAQGGLYARLYETQFRREEGA